MSQEEADLWRRASEVLDQALTLPLVEQKAFVDRACAGDGALRQEVEALLAVDTSKLRSGQQPVFDFKLGTSQQTPHRIGDFEVIRELGRGGSSVVYLCHRPDPSDRTPVAIKVLRQGMESDEMVRRFRREGDILARLRHPYIGAVLGGGILDDGRPYLIMTKVEGQPIDLYCRQNPDLQQILRLFIKVCEAVQYAHQRLIIHRDLKPSNILITENGEPRLLDFGIAKLLDPESDRPLTQTQEGLQRLTPAYASPEQILGSTATTACDVYALGVVLFELLVGQRPFQTQGKDSLSNPLLRRPVRASASITEDSGESSEQGGSLPVSAGLRRRQLRGDLDTILQMALAPEIEERYRSVADLTADIHRYLENRPIKARPGSFFYRLGKFLRRHRVGVLVAALVCLILGGIAYERELQRQKAELANRQAERVKLFLVDLLGESEPYGGSGLEATLGGVLEKSRLRALHLEGDPELQSELLTLLGAIYIALAEPTTAEALLRDGLETRRQLWGDDHPLTAESLWQLGRARLAVSDFENAESLMTQALEGLERKLAPEDPRIAACLHALAGLQQKAGRLKEAEATWIRAHNMASKRLGPRSQITLNYGSNLGSLLVEMGRYEEAEERFLQVLDDSEGSDVSPSFRGAMLANLAVARIEIGHIDGVEAALREALETYRSIFGADHPQTAIGLGNLGLFLKQQGALEESLKHLMQQKEILENHLGSEDPAFAKSLENLASVEQRLGHMERAETRMRRALEIYQQILGDDHVAVARGANSLGSVLLSHDNAADALPFFEQAYAARRRLFGEDHVMTAISLTNQGRSRLHLGALAEAKSDLRQALEITSAALGASHWQTAWNRAGLAQALRLSGDLEAAEDELTKALATLEEEPKPLPAAANRVFVEQGILLLEQGKPLLASQQLALAHEGLSASYGPIHPILRQVEMLQLEAKLSDPNFVTGSGGKEPEASSHESGRWQEGRWRALCWLVKWQRGDGPPRAELVALLGRLDQAVDPEARATARRLRRWTD